MTLTDAHIVPAYPEEALSSCPCVLSTLLQSFLIASLLSGPRISLRLILLIFHTDLELLPKPGSFCWETTYKDHSLGIGYFFRRNKTLVTFHSLSPDGCHYNEFSALLISCIFKKFCNIHIYSQMINHTVSLILNHTFSYFKSLNWRCILQLITSDSLIGCIFSF